jgi:SAM-dependent methyltransferase
LNAWDREELSDQTLAFYDDARQRAHADFLDRHPPAGNRRLLDVGCGLGYFLARAQDRGWQVSGVDTSAQWVELANQRLGGRRAQRSTLERASFRHAPFSIITVWDVVEHIFEPLPFLAHLRSLLAPGGRLFIRTPNLAYVYPVYAGRRYLLKSDVELGPTNHVVYFTARTLGAALRHVGLRPVRWPVHVPPQVTPSNRSRLAATVIPAKNLYAGAASTLASLSRGRLVVGSDLDVLCAAAGSQVGAGGRPTIPRP